MRYTSRILLYALASLVAHTGLVWGLSSFGGDARQPKPRKVTMTVVRPEPPPEPPPEPTPPPEPEPLAAPKVVEKPKKKPKLRPKKPAKTPPPEEVPPPNTTEVATENTTAKPVFGISMSSVSASNTSAPSVKVGNTLMKKPDNAAVKPADVKPYAPPAAIQEISRMPRMLSRCKGTYTPEARKAGLEGSVTLNIVVDTSGRATQIKVVKGLGHGLTQAAVQALKRCRFSPGERNGKAVAVPIRGFKIRFLLDQ